MADVETSAAEQAERIDDEQELEYDSAGEEYPKNKSDVGNDKNAPPFACKFEKGQKVSMTVDDGVSMRKEVFLVKHIRGHNKSYWEYRLATLNGSVFNNGKYYRERDLRKESR